MGRVKTGRLRGRSSFLTWRIAAIFAVFLAFWLCFVSNVSPAPGPNSLNAHDAPKTDRKLLESDFPDDAFTLDQKRSGAVVLHFLAMIYMFVGLAIICDLYFVSALEIIVEKYDIEDDVAGATFMAAGGSAPELFTSIIGTFIAKSDVGFSTIVGSAVFNVLFVIGICAVGAGQVLKLTWYPLTRDSICYTICLCVLVGVIADQEVQLWEAIVMFVLYIAYVVVMKYNVQLRAWAMGLRKEPVVAVSSSEKEAGAGESTPGGTSGDKPASKPDACKAATKEFEAKADSTPSSAPEPTRKLEGRTFSEADHINNAGKQRRGSLDGAVLSLTRPRSAGSISGDGHHHAIKFQTMVDGDSDEPEPVSSSSPHSRPRTLPSIKSRPGSGITPRTESPVTLSSPLTPGRDPIGLVPPALPPKVPASDPANAAGPGPGTGDEDTVRVAGTGSSSSANVASLSRGHSGWHIGADDGGSAAPGTSPKASLVTVKKGSKDEDKDEKTEEEEEEEDEPLIDPWPKKNWQRAWWCFKAPLMYLLAYTVPDCRGEGHKWFVATFIMSILYIGLFSYVMVWMADVIGRTIGIPDLIMGVTILAAGTSIPDALSSLIVARNGHGDMAVSSSIGSNIFDITVGLPIPWLLFYMVSTWDSSRERPVKIESDTLWLSVITLLGMLLATVVSIHCTGWKLDYRLGIVCIVLYFIFIAETMVLAAL